jgi:hypothetical protein
MACIIIKACFSAFLFVAIVKQAECTTQAPSDETKAPEENANYVLVHFMDKKRDEFFKMLPNIKDAIASSLNAFCLDESPRCGTEIS